MAHRRIGGDPMVHLAPDDVRTAQTAGVEFARSLAGAPSAWFMLALGEQEDLIRSAIRQAGYPDRTHGSRRTPSMSERGLNGSASPAPCGPRRGVWHERPGATRLPPWRMPGKPRPLDDLMLEVGAAWIGGDYRLALVIRELVIAAGRYIHSRSCLH
jgi:hypothetical protein